MIREKQEIRHRIREKKLKLKTLKKSIREEEAKNQAETAPAHHHHHHHPQDNKEKPEN